MSAAPSPFPSLRDGPLPSPVNGRGFTSRANFPSTACGRGRGPLRSSGKVRDRALSLVPHPFEEVLGDRTELAMLVGDLDLGARAPPCRIDLGDRIGDRDRIAELDALQEAYPVVA